MGLEYKPITKSAKQRYTLGIVYEPDVLDSHGDFANEDVIRESAWKFAKRLQARTSIEKQVLSIAKSLKKAVTEEHGKEQRVQFDPSDPIMKFIHSAMSAANGIHQPDSLTPEDVEHITKLIDDGSPLGDQHEIWDSDHGDIVDFFVAPTNFRIGDEVVTKGTWCIGVVWSPEMFEKIENGERTGLSLGAFAVTVEVEDGP